MDLKCQILPVTFINEAAQVMSEAFSDSPAYNYIFQHDQEYRRHALEWLFRRNLRLVCRRYPSALRGILNEMGQVVACFLWTPSPHHQSSTWDMLVAGMWLVPYRFGIPTLMRLMQLADDFDGCQKRFFDNNNGSSSNNNFVLLERMAVRSDCRGVGFGTQALQSVISQTHRPMCLATQEERNVRFYQRLGYSVVGEVDFGEDSPEYKFHSWFMVLQNVT